MVEKKADKVYYFPTALTIFSVSKVANAIHMAYSHN